MDRIRQALGARQLNYCGASYGTSRGAVYASMFPPNTGKIVLDSSTPPEGVTAVIRLTGEGVETAFPASATWAADHDSTTPCGRSARPTRSPTACPPLVLQNHAGPSTAYSGALPVRAALGRRAELTTIDGARHGVDLTHACTAGRLTDFLCEDHLPGRDTACP
ncbi:alpha/beta hydrolase [Amycolatopsis sp. NPDC023774]|uniref:alpha/beta hydrolase n=1 Tax=Amycolatopsis sp. NPDC023774 TaxID=3155015 RepID=UPI003406A23A